MQVRFLRFKHFRHITHVKFVGYSNKLSSELETLFEDNKDQNTKMAAFIVSREGRHYSKSDRI